MQLRVTNGNNLTIQTRNNRVENCYSNEDPGGEWRGEQHTRASPVQAGHVTEAISVRHSSDFTGTMYVSFIHHFVQPFLRTFFHLGK